MKEGHDDIKVMNSMMTCSRVAANREAQLNER
jgi:hypothetical protein